MHTCTKLGDVPYRNSKYMMFVRYVSAIGKQMQSSATTKGAGSYDTASPKPQREHSLSVKTEARALREHSQSVETEARALQEHSSNVETEVRALQEHSQSIKPRKSTSRALIELETEARALQEQSQSVETEARALQEHSSSSRPRREHSQSTHRASRPRR